MKLFCVCALLLVIGLTTQSFGEESTPESKIAWVKWTPDLFERAKKEDRLVLLDLEAVWCHWCHVMDHITYSDPTVSALIAKKYIAVKVDQDSAPELSNRYEDYGWPATIIFDSSGKEIVKRSAYIPPKPMAALLQACIDDPTPGPSVRPEPELKFANSAKLSDAERGSLLEIYHKRYDPKEKGWGFVHKYLDWEMIEYSLIRAAKGDADADKMAKETMQAHQALLDPVWGGVYQYSTGGRWDEPHFEKIMPFQAETLRAYALAYAAFKDPLYLKSAQEIRRYLHDFLTDPIGAFYTSQNADVVDGEHSAEYFKLNDAERRKVGMPRIDKHIYSRENGHAINALAVLYQVSGDQSALDDAKRAADWIFKNRALPDGGFAHGDPNGSVGFLGDTLMMGRACLTIYEATGDRHWLERAENAVQYIEKNFKIASAGYATAAQSSAGALGAPKPQREENGTLARLANLLSFYTGKTQFRTIAEHAFLFLTAPEIAERYPPAVVLLPDQELSEVPIHFVVVGKKDDPQASLLFREGNAFGGMAYKWIEWLDSREGPLPNPDSAYPAQDKAAIYICANGRCSKPVKITEEVSSQARRVLQPK